MHITLFRRAFFPLLLLASLARAADAPQPQPIEFTQETLPNGLRVVYAPLHNAPVVHVRVLYHVGSRNERPDRQGFAHMFEHMMFRGSAHVKPEEHMKLIGTVGGMSNAFTSFDQTVYINTIPAEHLEMALYLEADRMASFKVSDTIFQTERKVVTEEWRMKENRPYGNLFEKFAAAAFTAHPYRWTPIGNMDHLRAAAAPELQAFFNRYYLPNNAVLVIAGDINVQSAKALVQKYFAWIPAGAPVQDPIPAEPPQTAARRVILPLRVPLPAITIGYHTPSYQSDDHQPLQLLADILGNGRSSRLDRSLVNSAKPLCVDVSASNWKLQDSGLFVLSATVLNGQNPDQVESALTQSIAEIIQTGVTPDELEKVRTARRIGLIHERETATSLAEQLGKEALIGLDPSRVNTELDRLNAVTPDQIRAVAAKYLQPTAATTLVVQPDPNQAMTPETAATTHPASDPLTAAPRALDFPPNYPATPPIASPRAGSAFEKGTETSLAGVRVIVMPDHRLPLVNFSLTLRRGSHSDPRGKEGLADLTASMLRRGADSLSYSQLNTDLESRGISLDVSDGGDHTRLSASCTTEQLDHALLRATQVLRKPTFPADEFAKLQAQEIDGLRMSEADPSTVASHELARALYGDQSPLGVHSTPQSLASITLDDIKNFYHTFYHPNAAILVFSGDISPQRGQQLASQLLADFPPAPNLAPVTYPAPPDSKPRIILVDRPEGRQATIRMGIRAYDIHTDEKFAGSLANQILTAGIDSRLGRYVRAEKGLAYGVHGVFQPTRHGGAFIAGTDTRLPTAADAIEAIFKVLSDMRTADVTDKELTDAKLRVAGSMVMSMQTISQQSGLRLDGILNDYPINYYDLYPARVGAVLAPQLRDVMNHYIHNDQMVIVVVAPAPAVQKQLEKLAPVEVIPMPNKRPPSFSY